MAESSPSGEGRGRVRWGRVEEHYLVCVTLFTINT
jgi:hypothetical protein